MVWLSIVTAAPHSHEIWERREADFLLIIPISKARDNLLREQRGHRK